MKILILSLTMLIGVCFGASAQEHQISGKVVGEDNSPLPGITIQVKDASTGTATDATGKYELSVPNNATLIFRGVGYTEQQIAIGKRSVVNVAMHADTKQLNELIVTAMGIKRAARSVGYATASVDSKELNTGNPVNLQTGLTGRVAGLQINTINNGVNPSYRVVLRGERHITADNQALIVLDGMLVTADVLSTLNPEDIASISILKGASASALYGSEASNGVMIITTKHGGNGGKPRVTLTSTVQFQRLSYLPKFQKSFGANGGEASVNYGYDGKFQWGTDPYTNQSGYVPYENESYGSPFNGQMYVVGGPLADGSMLKLPYVAAAKPPLLAFAQTGKTFQNGVSYSSGDNMNNFFLSVQDVSSSGVIPKDVSRRDNFRFGSVRTYGKFSAQFDLNYSKNDFNISGGDPVSGSAIVWNLLNLPVNYPIEKFKDYKTNPFANPLEGWPNAYYTNPYWQIDASRNNQDEDVLTGTMNLSLHPLPWLSFTYKLGANLRNFEGKNTIDGYQAPDPYYYTPSGLGPWAAYNYLASAPSKLGQLSDYNYYYRRLQQDFLINFDKSFGDFKVDAFLGNTIWDRYVRLQYDNSSNAFIPEFFNISYITGVPTASQSITDSRLIGVYGDVTVGYKNWIFLHGSLRNDWTSLLAKGNNSYLYPDIDGSWVFTDAIPSLHGSSFLTYGKLRAAYSITGEVSVPAYSIENTFNVPSTFPYGSLASLQISGTLNNPKLKPEKSYDKEIGLDLGFWSGRINVTADYYNTKTVNQTFAVGLSTSSGFSQAQVNGGTMVSDGFELSVDASPLVKTASGFTWNVAANLAINNSNVVSLYGGVPQYQIKDNSHVATTSYAVVGQPYPVIEASDYARDSATNKILVGPNGMPEENPSLIIAGRSTPKYIIGFNTSLSYKHFTLAISGDYRGGYNIVEAIGGSLDFTGTGWRDASAGRQDFVFPNSEIDEGNGKHIPNTGVATTDGNLGLWVDNANFAYSAGIYNYTAHTNYVVSAAALKLRAVSLTYDFSWLLSRTKFITGGSLSIVGNNLLMFVPSQNIYGDPEFNEDNSNATGYTDQGEFPATRNFGANLTLNF